uniref:MIF4G domain-containing protein n=1 Tax=viral metagenome TaxID=1070528 RepID=A0A6C0CTE3_9ZZZZ
MDFVRYDTTSFYNDFPINANSKEYIKLKTMFEYIKETYSCFNPSLKSEIYTKKMIKKPQVISNNEIHAGKKNLISCLNKLTKENYNIIFRKILLAVQVNDVKEFVQQIIQTCLNSKVYHELYVGLIIHLYCSGKEQISSCISEIINEYFDCICHLDFFKLNDDEKNQEESYNDFCDRVNAKCKKIFTIKVFFMFHLSEELSKHLTKTPQDIIQILSSFLEECIHQNNKECTELILLCIKDCYENKDEIKIPSIHLKTPIVWKEMTKIDFKLPKIIQEYIDTGNPVPKVRFICLDLLALLNKHQQNQKQ